MIGLSAGVLGQILQQRVMGKGNEPGISIEPTEVDAENDIVMTQILNHGEQMLNKAKSLALGSPTTIHSPGHQEEVRRHRARKVNDKMDNETDDDQQTNMDTMNTEDGTDGSGIFSIDSFTTNEDMNWASRIMTFTKSKTGGADSSQNRDPALDDVDERYVQQHGDDMHYHQEQKYLTPLVQPQQDDQGQTTNQEETVHDNILGLLQSHRHDGEMTMESYKQKRRGSIQHSIEPTMTMTMTYNHDSDKIPHTSASNRNESKSCSSSTTGGNEDFRSRPHRHGDGSDDNDSSDSDDDSDNGSLFFDKPSLIEDHQSIGRSADDRHNIEHAKKNGQEFNRHQHTIQHSHRYGANDTSGIDSQHQILFENLDRTIQSCRVEEEYNNDANGREDDSFLLSLMETRELTKLCFAAMAIIFSSKRTHRNASNNNNDNNGSDQYPFTTIVNEDKYNDDRSVSTKEDSSCDIDSPSSSVDFGSSATKSSLNSDTDDADSADRPLIPLCVVTMLWRELLQRRCRRERYNDDHEDADETEIDDDDTEGHFENDDDNDDDTNGGIPMSEENISTILDKVLHTLVNELSFLDVVSYRRSWSTNIEDNCNDLTISLPCQVVHVKELGAAQEQDPTDNKVEERKTSSQDNLDSSITVTEDGLAIGDSMDEIQNQQQNNQVQCIKVNHNVHLLYGRHIAKNFTKSFTFRNKKHGAHTKHRYSTGCFDDNPEVAMNAVMAAACSTCIERANPIISRGGTLPPTLQLQYEYSMEMLPWHLMQSLQYKYVVDVLTDETFVCRRIELMEFCAASNAHISDVEDLFNRTTKPSATSMYLENTTHLKFADVNMTDVFLDSYRLFGDTIQREEVKKLKQPFNEEDDEHEKEVRNEEKDEEEEIGDVENLEEEEIKDEKMEKNSPSSDCSTMAVSKISNTDTSELKYILEISLALRSMGDSLFMHGLKSEAMAFFYRALVRYEHTHAICALQTEIKTGNRVAGVSCPDDLEDSTSDVNVNNVIIYDSSNLKDPLNILSPNDDGGVPMGDIQFFMGEILSRIASVFQSLSSSTEEDAMLCYDRALSFYSRQSSEQHMEGVAQTLSSIGLIHLDKNEYESALSCFEETLLLLKSQQDDDGNETNKNANEIASILAFMGTVRKEMDIPNEALDCFSQALYEKVIACGQFHPEVGFLQHSIAKIHSELNEIPKALVHFEEALRVRRVNLQSVRSDHDHHMLIESSPSSGRGSRHVEIVKNNELLVAETLLCAGTVYEASGDNENAFTALLENALIHRSHLINLAADQGGVLMINDIVKLMQEDPDSIDTISNLFDNLAVALDVGHRILTLPSDDKAERLLEIKGQVADLELFIGMIYGARYFQDMEKGNKGKTKFAKEAETSRSEAKEHLEQSLYLRRKCVGINQDFIKAEDASDDHVEIINAFILYELGKLFSFSVLKETIPQTSSYSSLFFSTQNLSGEDGDIALSYFEEARSILQGNAGLIDAVDSLTLVNNPWEARLQKTPVIYEDMLQMMAILYRKLDEYDKSVECYNEVSILLTRMGLGDNPNVDSQENKVHNQKEKVAIASQSIGDILSDTGEYPRALKSYDEALQLRRLLDKDSLEVADTLCLKGMVYLKLKEWGQTILTFDEALRIRVDRLPEDHRDIAACFHQIGKGYEGNEKFEQALEYYKKSQRIVSDHSIEKDLHAADLLYDLGNIVLVMSNLSECMICTAPTGDDISLALSCLVQSRAIYTSNFGNSGLEVGNTLSLLGVIYARFGDYEKAIDTYEDALSIYRNVPLDQSLLIAKTLNHLSLAIIKSEGDDGENSKSLQYLQLAQQIYEDKGETNGEQYVDVLFNLGAAYVEQDAIIEAITSYEDALTVSCVALGRDHIRTSVILEKLGSCLIRTREHTEAMEFLVEGLEVRKKHARYNDLVSADIHFAMGIIHCESGELNDALDCYEEAMRIRCMQLGDDHVEVAQILNNIGSVFARNGEYQRALKPWQRALEMYRLSGLDEEHQKVAITLGNIALSKNLVSVKEQSGLEYGVRKVGSW